MRQTILRAERHFRHVTNLEKDFLKLTDGHFSKNQPRNFRTCFPTCYKA